eukprot:sb/3474784/
MKLLTRWVRRHTSSPDSSALGRSLLARFRPHTKPSLLTSQPWVRIKGFPSWWPNSYFSAVKQQKFLNSYPPNFLLTPTFSQEPHRRSERYAKTDESATTSQSHPFGENFIFSFYKLIFSLSLYILHYLPLHDS